MKRSITTWTTTLATAALLGLPVAAVAKPQQPSTPPQEEQPAPQPTKPQQPKPAPQPKPQPTEPQPTQPPTQPPAQPQPTRPQQPQPAPQPTQPQPTEPQPAQPTTPPATATQQPPAAATTGAADQSASPEEHLRQAREALSAINTASIPASKRSQLAELRRHLTALEKPAASTTTSQASRSAKTDNWGTEVAAIDRIITNLAGSDTAAATTGASTTGATGTSGRSRASAATIDEATKAKLMEIRTHITAYAAAKSGASASPRSDAAMTTETPAAQPSTTEPSPAAAQSPTPV
jgi:hypothetical protein